MFGQLGNIQFDHNNGPDGFSKSMGISLAQMDRATSKPTLQDVGGKLNTIKLKFSLKPSAEKSVEARIDEFEAAMDAREPLTYITGTGRDEGIYLIEDLTYNTRQTDGRGRLIYAELIVDLKEYVSPDPAGDEALAKQKTGFANISVNPIVATPEVRFQTPESLIMRNVIVARADAKAANETLRKTSGLTSNSTLSYLNQASRALNRARTATAEARQQVDSVAAKIGNAAALKSSMETVISNIDLMLSNFTHGNLPSLRNASVLLDSNLQSMFYTSSQLANVISTRK